MRKACSESIGAFTHELISKHSPISDSISSLIIIVDKYLKDESKYVKLSIFKEFGKFIYEISQYNQTEFNMKVDKLIVNYLEERDNKSFEDIDIINLHTAFNMPSIILVSSPKLWKFISEHYFNL